MITVEEIVRRIPEPTAESERKIIIVASSDRLFAESLRSHLAKGFDVLLAKDCGEASTKAQATSAHLVIIDLEPPLMGMAALSRLRDLREPPLVCALALPKSPTDVELFDFDYVLARPENGSSIPERIRFIFAKESEQRA